MSTIVADLLCVYVCEGFRKKIYDHLRRFQSNQMEKVVIGERTIDGRVKGFLRPPLALSNETIQIGKLDTIG